MSQLLLLTFLHLNACVDLSTYKTQIKLSCIRIALNITLLAAISYFVDTDTQLWPFLKTT